MAEAHAGDDGPRISSRHPAQILRVRWRRTARCAAIHRQPAVDRLLRAKQILDLHLFTTTYHLGCSLLLVPLLTLIALPSLLPPWMFLARAIAGASSCTSSSASSAGVGEQAPGDPRSSAAAAEIALVKFLHMLRAKILADAPIMDKVSQDWC